MSDSPPRVTNLSARMRPTGGILACPGAKTWMEQVAISMIGKKENERCREWVRICASPFPFPPQDAPLRGEGRVAVARMVVGIMDASWRAGWGAARPVDRIAAGYSGPPRYVVHDTIRGK